MSKGLIVLEQWGEKIFDDNKTWEIRSKDTTHRGFTEAIYSGTEYRFGSFVLVDSIYVPKNEFWDHQDKHRIKPGEFDIDSYDKIFAWVLKDASRYKEPIRYEKKRGQVVWVNL